jgi:transcriptional regulator with XRE-family HTH domain
MEHDAVPLTPTRVVAERVFELRKERRLTAAQLADRMTKVGIPWKRGVVAKLEKGYREDVSVAELLALAVVLEVAPVHLLVPLENSQPYEVTPGRVEPAHEVRSFVIGNVPLEGIDPRRFYSQVPADEWELVAASREGDEAGQMRALREEMQRLRDELGGKLRALEHPQGPGASDG